MNGEPFEVWENDDGTARFTFSHSDANFTTGILYLAPGTSLAKHNRPGGYENLTQVYGVSQVTVFSDEETVAKVVDLKQGEVLKMDKGQWHIHANTTEDISLTFFKLVGDITDIMQTLRSTNKQVILDEK